MIRGKTLSHEELLQLLVNEEPIFQYWDEKQNEAEKIDDWDIKMTRGYCGTLRNIIHRKCFSWLDGMVYCDGTIFGNFYEQKYPEFEEYIDKWKRLAQKNPFVDMVVSYTDIDECPCYGCRLINGDYNYYLEEYEREKPRFDIFDEDECYYTYGNDCILRNMGKVRRKAWECSCGTLKFDQKQDGKIQEDRYLQKFFGEMMFWIYPQEMSKHVQITLHIHDGKVDTYCGEQAVALFQGYDRLYGDFRMWVVNNSEFFGIDSDKKKKVYIRFDDAFMRECFRFAGLEEAIYDTIVKPEYLIDLSERETQVVTKQWLLEEYDKHFRGTELDIVHVNQILYGDR